MLQAASRTLVILFAGTSIFFSAGCATKNYVKKQSAPIVDKTNELDDLTAKNTRDIKDTDERAQKGISDVKTKADAADQKALAAGKQADEAQGIAQTASTNVNTLATTVANLDNYHPVVETSVHFAFAQAVLTKKAKEALDKGLQALGDNKPKEAEKFVDEAAKLAPGHPDVLFVQGVLYLSLRNWAQAQGV